APQNGADARRQLAGVEGFWEVIVGAQLEPDDTVDILASRREHDHRNFAALPQPAKNLETVYARQHDVEHYQVDRGLGGVLQSAPAFVLAANGESLALQKFAEETAQLRVIVDQQDVHA